MAAAAATQRKTVFLIHDSGKNNEKRGTSKREDVLDAVLNLRRPEDYDPEHRPASKFALI
jgi:hypothetical protein